MFVRGYPALSAGNEYSLYIYDIAKNPVVNKVVNARLEIRSFN